MTGRYGLEIRAATPADAAALSELLQAAGQPVPAPALATRLEAMQRGAGTALLALEWGPPSGLVVLHWYAALRLPQPVACITELLVAPDDRRRGIGRLLVKAAAQAARNAGCGTLLLTAPPEQPELAAFCRDTGFTVSATGYERALRKRGGEAGGPAGS